MDTQLQILHNPNIIFLLCSPQLSLLSTRTSNMGTAATKGWRALWAKSFIQPAVFWRKPPPARPQSKYRGNNSRLTKTWSWLLWSILSGKRERKWHKHTELKPMIRILRACNRATTGQQVREGGCRGKSVGVRFQWPRGYKHMFSEPKAAPFA